jgi:hypothetical protein
MFAREQHKCAVRFTCRFILLHMYFILDFKVTLSGICPPVVNKAISTLNAFLDVVINVKPLKSKIRMKPIGQSVKTFWLSLNQFAHYYQCGKFY